MVCGRGKCNIFFVIVSQVRREGVGGTVSMYPHGYMPLRNERNSAN